MNSARDDSFRPEPRADAGPVVVELRTARIPVIGFIARHHWFVIEHNGGRDRWEVWQTADAGGVSWGHLHRNLLPPERGVGQGPGWMVRAWHGNAARQLALRITTSPQTYPFTRRYHWWPGPNSNTYVQWVLGDDFRLGPKAPGRSYAGVP